MYVQLLFGINVAFGFVAWAVVTAFYIWPELQSRSRIEALRPLLALHEFRFIVAGARCRHHHRSGASQTTSNWGSPSWQLPQNISDSLAALRGGLTHKGCRP